MSTTGFVSTGYVIFGKKNCTACDQAKALLEAKGIGYEVVDVMTTPTAQALFRENGWRSVPQIMIGGEHIGGFEQLKEKFLGEQE